jgi:hypothetical protein
MKMELWAIAFLFAVAPPGAAVAQVQPDEPTKTTLCELVKTAERLNGKIVTIHGAVLIGFEDFELDATKCDVNTIRRVWLEYGRGPKRQPTTWCCGDMVPRDPLAVVQDDEFHRFHHYITAGKPAESCNGCYLYQYQVTATLTGRFDAGRLNHAPATPEKDVVHLAALVILEWPAVGW